MTGRALVAAFLAAMLSALPAAADDAPGFYLDLDTGGHRAAIRALAATPDGETIVSASEDKTIRVWDWRSGQTVRTIRGQIGPGSEGKVYALAVSPDGQTLAAGGYFGPGLGDRPPYGDVRLFDLASGRLTGVLKGLDWAVHGLAFSPDGALLAGGGEDGVVRIWQRPAEPSGAWSAREPLDADSELIMDVAFAAGGNRIVAATRDGLRLWDAQGNPIALPDAEELYGTPLPGLAVSPDGSRFATSAADGRLDIWNAADGSSFKTLPDPGFRADAIAFAGNDRLVVNCSYRCADRNRSIVVDIATGATVAEYRGHDGSVTAAVLMPDGKTVATAGGMAREIHLWDTASGAAAKVLKGVGRPVTAVAIDSQAGLIAWGNDDPCPAEIACPEAQAPLTHQLALPGRDRDFEEPHAADADATGLRRAVAESGEWSIHAQPGGDDSFANAVLLLRRAGKLVEEIENDATNGYVHAAYTLLATAPELVTGGGDGTLIAYGREDGSFAGEFLDGHTGAVDAMAEAPKAKYLLTGSADQTIRLWNLATRKLIVSMFFTDEDWIIWTPQGYFHSSPDGDRLVGWHVNQGQDREARFVRARQLKRHLNSPEIVRRAIVTGDASQAATELRGSDRQLGELLQRKPPEFSVRLAEGVKAADGFVAVEITGAAEAGADVSQFTVLSNDRRIDQFASRAATGGGDRMIIEVPVEEGQNQILVTGTNEFGYLTERSVVALAKKRPAEEEKKGKLYAVAIGVEDYPLLPTECNGRSCNLAYPVDDAADFLRVLSERTASLYSGMEALVLLNRDALDADPERAAEVQRIAGSREILDPDSRNIDDQLVDFLAEPGPDDTTIIFVAGHGINVDENYYFIPTDGRMRDTERWRMSSLVDWRHIQEAVEEAKGRRIMVLDTCHAANAFNPRLEKDAADARIVVFSATAANNTAAELPELGHGVFTYSMLEGLKGEANTSGDGVRLLGLADYVYREVVRLSKKQQEPYYHISQTANFLLAPP